MEVDANNNNNNKPAVVQDISTQPSVTPHVSESACERAVYIWELDEKSFPLPIFPVEEGVNPDEPARERAPSLLDLEIINSPPFIRGQDVKRPTEWQLSLRKNVPVVEDQEAAVELLLICHKDLLHSPNPVLVKLAYEVVNNYGVVTYTCNSKSDTVYSVAKGGQLLCTLGTFANFKENRSAFLDENRILRLRLRLNIYQDLPLPLIKQLGNNVNDQEIFSGQPPAKRRRLEIGSLDLANLFGSLDKLWKDREECGDITIRCGDRILKAHKFILSSHSDVFKTMLASGTEMKENVTNEINVQDVSPEIMNALLEYLYLGDTNGIDWANVDHICALIYAVDKYWIHALMIRCYQTLMKMMNLENFGQIAKVTFMYNAEKEFKDEVRHFYESYQITLNGVSSFKKFAWDDFDEFRKLFFYPDTL